MYSEESSKVTRQLILATLMLYLAWQYFRLLIGTQEENLRLFPLTVLVVGVTIAALRFQKKKERLAGALWLLAIAFILVLFLIVFRNPETCLLFFFLPFLALIMVGWQAALFEFAFMVVVIVLLRTQGILSNIPSIYLKVIFIGGAVNTLFSWIVSNIYSQVSIWSDYNYQKAREELDLARDERLEFHQLEEDLLHANRELSRLSEKLKASNQIAEEAVRVKEEFVANVSHELRTPLNMIIGFCEMITQSPQAYGKKLPALLLADITAIQRNSQHLSQLVNDVLDLSQIDAGRMALSKSWVNLEDILREATEAISDFFSSKNLYLRVSLPDAPVRLFCDRTRIREVILNLLSNAGRFTVTGGAEIKVQLESDQVILTITDTGPGIAPEDQARLFEPFQQLSGSIQRRYGGSGLGLYISRQFVEMHGGKMGLESVVGTGTSIYFSLPMQIPTKTEAVGGQSIRRWVNPYIIYEGRTRKFKLPEISLNPRFVVLEDGETLTRLFRRYGGNVEIEHVKSFPEIREAVKREPAQAVVVNVPPGEYSDMEMAAFITDLPYHTLVLSCWIQANDETARNLGVTQYLVKPIDRNTLLSAISTVKKPVRQILLVDDQPELLQLFTRMLASSNENYQVIRARDGQQALDLLRSRKPDVMLLDLLLDKMDGFTVIKEKREDPSIRDIPVIVISSLDPTGSPVISDSLTVQHKGGLSVRELFDCIQAVSLTLVPQAQSSDPMSQPASPG